MTLDTCNHTEPRCETEEKCADRERFKRNCESIQFTALDERAFDVRKRDKEFAKDAAAYRRLRANGLQPKGVNKSAVLETMADHRAEVAIGRSITPEERSAYNRNLGAIA